MLIQSHGKQVGSMRVSSRLPEDYQVAAFEIEPLTAEEPQPKQASPNKQFPCPICKPWMSPRCHRPNSADERHSALLFIPETHDVSRPG